MHICTLRHSGESLQNGYGNHRVTALEKNPVQMSKDEAPTPLSVVPGLGFGVGLVTGSCHSLGFFSWLALLFFALYRSFTMYE